MSSESEIKCPKCGASIPLDETLAAPAITKIRAEVDETTEAAEAKLATAMALEARLAAKANELAAKDEAMELTISQKVLDARIMTVVTEHQYIREQLLLKIEAADLRAKERRLQPEVA